MKEKYYWELAERLWQTVEKKDLGEELERTFNQYAFMLKENILEEEAKYQISILAEKALSNVRDVPDKSIPISGNAR